MILKVFYFENMTKAVIIGGAMMAEDMNLQHFRYQYAILCFRTLVLECQRLNFVNEINQFFSSYKNQKRYNYQLEFDIFNFECSHEIFALLSQNVYVPIPVE